MTNNNPKPSPPKSRLPVLPSPLPPPLPPPLPETKATTPKRAEPEVRFPDDPVLRFTPTAWAKLLFMQIAGDTEVGGFGISHPEDPLLVIDFVTVKQKTSVATVALDDEAVAEFFEEQVELGRRPEQFARLWVHTHPGNSPRPSITDEVTFTRVFGSCHWAVMFIIAEGGQTFARLRFNVGPGGEMPIPVRVDYSLPFTGSDFDAWTEEYMANINAEVPRIDERLASTEELSRTDRQEFLEGAW